jgi:ABC-2 type transport system ATP-binding protein
MKTPGTPAPVTATTEDTVVVDAISHRYGERTALRDVSFSVKPGEILAVLGPNGGGKSTLFRILSTLVPPTEGTVRMLGRAPGEDHRGVRRAIGVVFQSPSLDFMLSGRENLMHQGHLYGLRGRALKGRMADLLEVVGLAERASEPVSSYSGGMRRRLEIAKALLHAPQVVLLDEPSTGLDPAARLEMWDHLKRLRDDQGVTLVFTTHLLEEADSADRVAVLDGGRLVALDTPDQLKAMVGGDVLTLETDDPAALARDIAARFDLQAAVTEGKVHVERERGHEFLTDLIEAFPGRIDSVSLGKPTLDDVFLHVTGHTLAEADLEAPAPPVKRKRRV